jgi:hypothetical protein
MDLFSYLLGKKSGGLNWKDIGYNNIPEALLEGYNYAKNVYDNWEPRSNMNAYFYQNQNLIFLPNIDLTTAIDFTNCFSGCKRLIYIPSLNLQSATGFEYMFFDCTALKNIDTINSPLGEKFYSMFGSCTTLESINTFISPNAKNYQQMFSGCTNLKNIPLLSSSNVTNFSGMFTNTKSLSNDSINNVLQMCINATSYSGTKTLYVLGFRSSNYSASRIQSLPKYQDFIDAGWTIGY